MLFTLGHSTLALEAFVTQAQIAGVSTIIDVRSHPTSRWNQWREENMRESLPKAGLQYLWEPGLGGWLPEDAEDEAQVAKFLELGVDVHAYSKGKFPKQRIAGQTGDTPMLAGRPVWTSQGLYDYSWFMTTPRFLQAADRLLELGSDKTKHAALC